MLGNDTDGGECKTPADDPRPPGDHADEPPQNALPTARPATQQQRGGPRGGVASFGTKFAKAKRLAQSGYYPTALAAVRNLAPRDRDYLLTRLTKGHIAELQALCDQAIRARKGRAPERSR